MEESKTWLVFVQMLLRKKALHSRFVFPFAEREIYRSTLVISGHFCTNMGTLTYVIDICQSLDGRGPAGTKLSRMDQCVQYIK